MGIADFIDAIAADNKVDAQAAFEAELKSRVTDAIDAKRIEVGQAMSSYSVAAEVWLG
jgi:hypothetical protein